MYWFSILARRLASLYDGAFMLWIAGGLGCPFFVIVVVLLVLVVRVYFGSGILSFVCL
jgi:hypothetical protein